MARRQKKYHYIYKTTCILTNRYYIGMHSTDNIDDNYLGSGKRLWNSINYHGRENHKKEILEFFSNREELKLREKKIVDKELINDHYCMNLQLGGGGGFKNELHMIKTSKAGNDQFKKNMTDPEYRRIFSQKMSEATKKSFELGKRVRSNFYDWTGKKHTEESKQKLSLIKKNTGVGSDNSVWGMKWMNKETKNKMVRPEDINQYLSDGWNFGQYISEERKLILRNSMKNTKKISKPSCIGRKWINKDGKNKRVLDNELNNFLMEGWTLGCLIKK